MTQGPVWIELPRRSNATGLNGSNQRPVLNYDNEQIFAQGMLPYAEMSRRNIGWQVMSTAAIAGLVVRPDTVAKITLWNGNTAASQIAFVIDQVYGFNLVTTAALSGWSLWTCVHKAMAAPTADITAIKSMSGYATAYAGAAVVDVGATVADDGWFPIGFPFITGGVTTAPSGARSVETKGRFIIPPQCGFSVQVVATIVGLTFTTGMSWYELVLPMG